VAAQVSFLLFRTSAAGKAQIGKGGKKTGSLFFLYTGINNGKKDRKERRRVTANPEVL